jgi:hypothetical protein
MLISILGYAVVLKMITAPFASSSTFFWEDHKD